MQELTHSQGYILFLLAQASCVSNPIRRRSRRAFCSRPERDGMESGSESGSHRTRRPRRGRLWACQSAPQFRRSFSFCRKKFSGVRARRLVGIPFRRTYRAVGIAPVCFPARIFFRADSVAQCQRFKCGVRSAECGFLILVGLRCRAARPSGSSALPFLGKFNSARPFSE